MRDKISRAQRWNTGQIYFRKEDVVDGNIKVIDENWKLPYTAFFIFCPLRANEEIPTSVSIYAYDVVKELRKIEPIALPAASNRVLVINRRAKNETGATMAACVAPIFANYSRVKFVLYAWQ
jgi:hypothetical protein